MREKRNTSTYFDIFASFDQLFFSSDILPRFTRPIANSTAVMGRDGHLVCHVENADPKEYKVNEQTLNILQFLKLMKSSA